jgi:hypothetical protein
MVMALNAGGLVHASSRVRATNRRCSGHDHGDEDPKSQSANDRIYDKVQLRDEFLRTRLACPSDGGDELGHDRIIRHVEGASRKMDRLWGTLIVAIGFEIARAQIAYSRS